MGYIDTHSHYFSNRYDKDRDEVFNEMYNNGVIGIIECGLDENSNNKVIKMTEKYRNVFGVIGFDPVKLDGINKGSIERFVNSTKLSKIVGIGEIGLDHYRTTEDKWLEQEKWFKYQLELAKELDLPVCIHSRDAKEDTLRILREFGKYKGVMHCFSYDVETMKELVELGYSFGIGGTSTYKGNDILRDAIKQMPLDRIVFETDAPYLTPEVVRGSRNISTNIKYVIENVSNLFDISVEGLEKISTENALRIYNKINLEKF